MLKHPAFSLLEIMLAMVVIGILSTMAVPRLIRRGPNAKWETVVNEVNNLLYFARQEAIATNNIYRLRFISKATKSSVIVEVEKPDPEKINRKIYETIKSYYFTPEYTFPDVITIDAVFHGKQEQLEENKDQAYCYVIPNGLVQEIFVHLTRDQDNKISKATFKIEPFLGKFELLDGHVKHE